MGTQEMAFRVRSSKFRHVYGNPAKKEQCFEGVKTTKNAHDSNFCAVNPKFLAVVTESAGGGAFLVIPLEKVGRVDINNPKICGHSGPVLDIKWNPFNDNIIASSSDDATIKLWQIPEGGLKSNLTEWLIDLHGHTRRVGYIEWHPTAENILLSAGYDFKCILWNTEVAEPINIISAHNDTIFSIAWSRDGGLFATTCKDKKIRVFDPRQGQVICEGAGHQGSKASKVVFLGEKNRLFTTGFSRMSERQYGIWDAANLSKPLKMDNIDSSSGVMIPFYDCDLKVVFLAGKGDGNIRYYEIVDEAPYIHYLSQYQSGSPQRGLGIMPKRGIDPSRCEIVRFYKLHTAKSLCEPISMIVPRKSEMFQDDIFPPTASSCPSLSADEWIGGHNREPILISLKDGRILPTPKGHAAKAVKTKVTQVSSDSSSIPVSKDRRKAGDSFQRSKSAEFSRSSTTNRSNNKISVKSSKVQPKSSPPKPKSIPVRGGRVSEIRRQFSKKDGAISHNPTITTYKAVKRGSSGTELISNKRTASPSTNKTSAAPEKLPASLKNIKKLSSTDKESAENNNVAGDVNSRISIFESKGNVRQTEATTRLTNDNEPLRVDKKVWTSAYTSPAVTNEVPNVNGTPKTDPEPHATGVKHVGSEKSSWHDQDDKENETYYSPPESNVSTSAFIQIGSGRRAQSFRGDTKRNATNRDGSVFTRKGSLMDFGSRRTTDAITTPSRIPDGRTSVRSTDSFLSNDSFGPHVADRMNDSYGTNESIGSENSDRFVTPPCSPLRPTQTTVLNQSSPKGPAASTVYDRDDVDPSDLWNENPLYSRGKYRKPTRRRQRDIKQRHTTDSVPNMSVDMTPLDDILMDFEESAKALEDKGRNKNPAFASNSSSATRLTTNDGRSRSYDLGDKAAVSRVKFTPLQQKSPQSDYSSTTNGAYSPTKEETTFKPPSDEYVMLGGSGSNSDAIIDCISKEAPDDTLIKPSKLRASMRSRKERSSLRGGAFRQDSTSRGGQSLSHSDLTDSRPRGSLSPDMGRLMGSRDNLPSSRGMSNARPKSFVQNGDEIAFRPTISPSARSNSVPEHKFKFSSNEINNNKNEDVRLQKSSDPDLVSSPMHRQGSFRTSASLILANSPSPRSALGSTSADDMPTSAKSPNKFSFNQPTSPGQSASKHMWDTAELAGETQPVITRQVARSRGSSRKLQAFSPDEEYSKVHIKKVWSPQSPPPAFEPALENGVPSTDPELRKAYFRQLEEINSLKDQLSLKDKRIRQLEEELRLLKPVASSNDMGESTC